MGAHTMERWKGVPRSGLGAAATRSSQLRQHECLRSTWYSYTVSLLGNCGSIYGGGGLIRAGPSEGCFKTGRRG